MAAAPSGGHEEQRIEFEGHLRIAEDRLRRDGIEGGEESRLVEAAVIADVTVEFEQHDRIVDSRRTEAADPGQRRFTDEETEVSAERSEPFAVVGDSRNAVALDDFAAHEIAAVLRVGDGQQNFDPAFVRRQPERTGIAGTACGTICLGQCCCRNDQSVTAAGDGDGMDRRHSCAECDRDLRRGARSEGSSAHLPLEVSVARGGMRPERGLQRSGELSDGSAVDREVADRHCVAEGTQKNCAVDRGGERDIFGEKFTVDEGALFSSAADDFETESFAGADPVLCRMERRLDEVFCLEKKISSVASVKAPIDPLYRERRGGPTLSGERDFRLHDHVSRIEMARMEKTVAAAALPHSVFAVPDRRFVKSLVRRDPVSDDRSGGEHGEGCERAERRLKE